MALTREQITANIDALEKQGASRSDIQGYLDSLGSQKSSNSVTPKASAPAKKTFLPTFIEKGLDKSSQFLYGTTGKTVGGALVGGVGLAQQLKGKLTGNIPDVAKGKQLTNIAKEQFTPKNVAFTALETVPTSKVTGAVSKLPGVSKIASGLKSSAVKQYTEALAPTTKEMKSAAAKVVPEAISRRITGNLKTIGEKASEAKDVVGPQIDDAIQSLKGSTSAKPIVNALNNLKKKAYMEGDLVLDETAVKAVDEVKSLFENAKRFDKKQLVSIRQKFDKAIADKKGFVGMLDEIQSAKIKAKRAAADTIRGIMAKESPELAKLNKEYSFWSKLGDVADSTAARKASQSGSLAETVAQGVGFGVGSQRGIGAAVGSALALKYLAKAVKSPTWKTFSAVQKDKLASSLLSGGSNGFLETLRKLSVGLHNEVTNEK